MDKKDRKLGEEASVIVGRLVDSEPSTLNISQFDQLKSSLLSFFKERINSIQERERLKAKVEDSFLDDLQGGELTFSQRLSLYNSVSKQENASADSLLSIFRPTPGAPSILAENLGKTEDVNDSVDEFFNSLDSDSISALEKLGRMIQTMSKKEEKGEE